MKRQDTNTQDFKLVEVPEKNLDMQVVVCGISESSQGMHGSRLNFLVNRG